MSVLPEFWVAVVNVLGYSEALGGAEPIKQSLIHLGNERPKIAHTKRDRRAVTRSQWFLPDRPIHSSGLA